MQWITSVFNKGIFLQNIRNVGWISIIYFLALFFTVPLQLLMIATRDGHEEYMIYFFTTTESLFLVLLQIQVMIMFTIPVLLGIFLFRYMQVKLSADFMFSLPMKRRVLLHQQLIFGIFALLIPIVLNIIILYVIRGVVNVEGAILFDHTLTWGITTFLFALLVYFATVALGMFTGISVLQAIFTYIFIALPAGITLLVIMNLSYYLKGFSFEHVLDENLDKLFLVVRAIDLYYRPLTSLEIIGYIAVIVVLYIISFIAYEKRPAEGATQAITFKLFRPIFWYGVTFCSMLLGGMYFAETQGIDAYGWIIFGYVTATIIGYYVATMILQKSWRVFGHYKGLGIFVASMLVIALMIKIDVFGYEKRLPHLEDVQQVYFGGNNYYFADDNLDDADEQEIYGLKYYKEKENIARIIDLHEAIINNSDETGERVNGEIIVIAYELQNGKKLVREYKNVYLPDYEQYYRPLVESNEFKQNNNVLLNVNKNDIKEIVFYNYELDKFMHFTEQEHINALYELIIEEYNEQTYEEAIDENSWAGIDIRLNDKFIHDYSFKKSYDKLTKWLDEHGKLRHIITTTDDLISVRVIKLPFIADVQDLYNMEGELLAKKSGDDVMMISEEEQMDELLRRSSQYHIGQYAVIYEFKMGHHKFELLSEENTPSFIHL